MYARIIYSQYHLGKMGEGLRVYRESILPALRRQEGFKSVLGLLDYRTNKSMSIALWETEEHLRRGVTSGQLQEQLLKVVPLFYAAPSIETADVSIWEVRPGITPQCARVTTFQLRPGTTTEFVQVIREKVLPLALEQKGAEGVVVLMDSVRSRVLTITLWEMQSDLEASENNGYVQQQLAQGAHYFAVAPIREIYETALIG